MTRYDSRAVVEDYAGVMALDKVLALCETGEDQCPVCGSELVPAEGRTGIYWGCVVPGWRMSRSPWKFGTAVLVTICLRRVKRRPPAPWSWPACVSSE